MTFSHKFYLAVTKNEKNCFTVAFVAQKPLILLFWPISYEDAYRFNLKSQEFWNWSHFCKKCYSEKTDGGGGTLPPNPLRGIGLPWFTVGQKINNFSNPFRILEALIILLTKGPNELFLGTRWYSVSNLFDTDQMEEQQESKFRYLQKPESQELFKPKFSKPLVLVRSRVKK